ncbi:unnamed protein product [Mytilus coruscus]|uniref:Endonuclease/exonuclease/phosphatase domain-containing protein n=1 Tax=Mytilus coruscus TaxID=42192 RepID=A0A6J8C7L6_MYTCO|nr:unnamed protein product [Mytilus coruscus]
MGNDAIAHRIVIGLFYHKICMVYCRQNIIVHLNIVEILKWLCKHVSNILNSALSRLKSAYSLSSFMLLVVGLLLLAGDIETNPGPGGTSDPHDTSLSIFHVNIRSIRNKIDYIVNIVQDFDIIFFTESHLDGQILHSDIRIEGFESPVRKDRNARGGGILMFYKSGVNIIRRLDLEHENVEITDSIPVIDCDTIPIDRHVSDHNGTYISLDCGFNQKRSFQRSVWNYKRGDYILMQQKIIETNWYRLIVETEDVNIACSNFTSTFLDIAEECIPRSEVTIRSDDKV